MGYHNKPREERFFLLSLVGLLILRFPVIILPRYGLLPFSQGTGLMLFETGTYSLTALMILLKRDCLEKYHIDRLALGLLVFTPIGRFVTQGILQKSWAGLPVSAYVNGVFALLFLLALLIWRLILPSKGAKETWRWVGVAVLLGIAFSAVTGYLLHFQKDIPPEVQIYLPREAARAVLLIFTQLSTAAALEEPLFRGFLWGELRERGWEENHIWLFQALLFALGHIYYLGTANLSFFVIVPLGALILGFMAWRSGSIGTSMLFHGIGNSLGGNFFALLWR